MGEETHSHWKGAISVKKLLLCLLLVLSLLPAALADALPGGVAAALNGADVLSSALWEESGYAVCFVLTRTADDARLLHYFTREGGAWTEAFATGDAVPHGTERVDLHFSDAAWDFTSRDSRRIPGPLLIILQHGAEVGSPGQMLCFRRTDGDAWSLLACRFSDGERQFRLDEGVLTCLAYGADGGTAVIGAAPCDVEGDLRRFRLEELALACRSLAAQ